VDVDDAEAGKARQLGGAAGRQNLRLPPAPRHLTEIEAPPTPGTSFFVVDRLCGQLSLDDDVVDVVIRSSINDNDKRSMKSIMRRKSNRLKKYFGALRRINRDSDSDKKRFVLRSSSLRISLCKLLLFESAS